MKMKFKHIDKEIRETLRIGITKPGEIIEEKREDVIEELKLNPIFEIVKENKPKVIKDAKAAKKE